MTAAGREAERPRRELWTAALHLFVLSGFAFAQPLYDMLSGADAFSIFRVGKPIDVLLLVFILSFLLPALGVLLEAVVGLVSRGLRRGLHALFVAGLVTLIALPPVKHLQALPPSGMAALAALAGLVVAAAYVRFVPVRTFLTVLSPAILIFPVLFLSGPNVRRFASVKNDPAAVVPRVDASAPVVVIVFDELPVTSLMDERRLIDPALYPNFAALAEQATWYRNVTTVADETKFAVPAILSGQYPVGTNFPTAADYPHNLFTLLGGTYDLHVYETHTNLCPLSLCPAAAVRPKLAKRTSKMLWRVGRLYVKIVLPPRTRGNLVNVRGLLEFYRSLRRPGGRTSVGSGGAAAGAPGRQKQDRSHTFNKFVESIAPGDRPALYFVHVMLPHSPWEFLPSGKRYPQRGVLGLERGLKGGLQWVDRDLLLRAYQRHLLQLGFVDRLVGMFIEKLKTAGLYEPSLIVVTADHGVSFRANDYRRTFTPTNYPDLLAVPLLIKAPYQDRPVISDRGLETVDILPTMADLLKIRLPWKLDGRSALDPGAAERTRRRLLGSVEPIAYAPALKYEALDRKLRLFSSGEGLEKLFRIGPHADLVGRNTDEIGFAADSEVRVEIADEHRFAAVDPDAALVPAMISGRVESASGAADTLDVAVALDGTVQALAKVIARGAGSGEFSVMVPETAFRPGRNVVEGFVVDGGGGQIRLGASDRTRTR